MPKRSPNANVSPGFFQQTTRRASIPGNLFTNHRDLAMNRQRILLVDQTRHLVRGHQKLAGRVNGVRDLAGYRRPVDVDVER